MSSRGFTPDRSLRPLQSLLIFSTLALAAPAAQAVSVEESSLSPGQAVVVQFTADEVTQARNRAHAASFGVQVANRMMRIAGIPESFSGKVAAVGVWTTLCGKYTDDIHREATRTPAGNNMTLRYRVDLEGVRRVWAASGALDHVIPGGELVGLFVDILNRLLNAVLQ